MYSILYTLNNIRKLDYAIRFDDLKHFFQAHCVLESVESRRQ